MNKLLVLLLVLMCFAAPAQLVVTVVPPKAVGQKADVELRIKNHFSENVESARAVCFLIDDNNKMVGQSAKWVIGAKNQPALEPNAETSFNFVITSSQPFTATNLTAKVSFVRIVLAGEKLADPKDVQVQNANK